MGAQTLRQRNSNIELLRIVCIIAIIAHHFAIHTNWNWDYNTISFNRVFLQGLCIGGKLGVNCFLLISGFFLVNRQSRNPVSIAKLWIQLVFYAVMIPVVFSLINHSKISVKAVILGFIPVTNVTWNYASAYIVLMLFIPFYNMFLQGISKKLYQQLLILFGICWCIIPTVSGRGFESNYLCWMFVMYSIGGYIRLYPNHWTESLKPASIGAVIFFALYIFSILIMDALGTRYAFFADNAREIRFGQMQMLPCVGLSVSLFLVFKNMRRLSSKMINFLAAGVFGVYLIHEHPVIKTLLWEQLFKNAEHYSSKTLPLYAVMVTLIVFICCEIIESIRRIGLEKHYMRGVSKLFNYIGSSPLIKRQ